MVIPHQTAFIHDKHPISDPKAANLTLYQHNKSVGVTYRLSMKWQSWHLWLTHTHTHTHIHTSCKTHCVSFYYCHWHHQSHSHWHLSTCNSSSSLFFASASYVPFVLKFILPLLHHPVASTWTVLWATKCLLFLGCVHTSLISFFKTAFQAPPFSSYYKIQKFVFFHIRSIPQYWFPLEVIFCFFSFTQVPQLDCKVLSTMADLAQCDHNDCTDYDRQGRKTICNEHGNMKRWYYEYN